MDIFKSFGDAIYKNQEFLAVVRKNDKFTQVLQAASSGLIHEILPEKKFSKEEILKLLFPLFRCAMIIKDPIGLMNEK